MEERRKYIFLLIIVTIILIVISIVVLLNNQEYQPPTKAVVSSIGVSNCKQLWLSDGYFIQSNSGFNATQNVLTNRGMVIDNTQAWENQGFLSGYVDEYSGIDGKKYTLWTTTRFERPNEANWRASEVFTSNDGISWSRPNLNLVDWNGSTANNMTAMQNSSRTMFVPSPGLLKNSTTKYLSLYQPYNNVSQKNILESNDGKNSTTYGNIFNYNYYTDGYNQIFYDSKIDKYVTYLRSWKESLKIYDTSDEMFGRGLSRIEIDPAQITSTWPIVSGWPRFGNSEPPAINADIVETPIAPIDTTRDIYYGNVMPYNESNCNGTSQVYLAFPDVFNKNDRSSEIYLLTSRDNKNWSWVNNTEAYIGKRVGNYDSLHVNNVNNYFINGSKLYQYYTGGDSGHDRSWANSKMFKGEQRVDGFVSLDAPSTEAVLTTKVLQFDGNSLTFNSASKALGGYIKVEVLDENGLVIPGFELTNSNSITTDSIENQITWNGKNQLCELVGRNIQLRIIAKESKMFSFQFNSNASCLTTSSSLSTINSSSTVSTQLSQSTTTNQSLQTTITSSLSNIQKADFNQDRKVNIFDFLIFRLKFGKRECNLIEDLYTDCKIDIRDFLIFRLAFNKSY